MNKVTIKLKNSASDEHLRDYLKSSYARRLQWLAEANEFALTVLKQSKKKANERVKRVVK